MALISWMVPRMLLVCVQATRRVCSERRGFSDSGVSCGFSLSAAPHHLMVRLRAVAVWTQGAMLASWSRRERISSEPGGKESAEERLRISCVVEEPRTGGTLGGQVCREKRWEPGVRSLGSTYFVGAGVDEASSGLHTLLEELSGLFANGIGTAHLNIIVAQIIGDAGYTVNTETRELRTEWHTNQ